MNLLRASTRARTRVILFAAPAALVLATAAACSSSSSPSTVATTATSSSSTGSASSGAASSSAALMVTSNQSLGQIVTTGSGITVYRYDADSDNPSKSNCNGGCASAWPPVLVTGSGTPQVSGVSSSLVGEVTRSDGSKQLTLGGWPLYTYAGDSGAGSTAGQGSGGTWWAVTPAGAKAAAGGGAATTATTASGNGGGGGY